MEARTIYTLDDKAPFSGSGLVLVTELTETQATLLHPVTLTEWVMPIEDSYNEKQGTLERAGFRRASQNGELYWPSEKQFNVRRIVDMIRERVQWSFLYEKPFPRESAVKALTELQGIPREFVEKDLEELKRTTVPVAKPKAKKPEQLKIVSPTKQESGNPAETKKMPRPKANNHREGVLYLALAKLDPEKLRGQSKMVAKALASYSSPKDLATITEKVEKNGEYKIGKGIAVADSVHYHLRQLVGKSLVSETKIETKKEEAKA